MYVATFYSFKGGVGRTMAAANAAVDLASRGKRVLLVDFDLEAPGLSTYAQFMAGAGSPGVVDYVTDFVATRQAPDVRDYVVRCPVSQGLEGDVLIMPAGLHDRAYAEKLSAIDWQRLYDELEGYLLFEDLKQQWAQIEPKLDYVLVDSRTGYTDVGGICTRQLPNAVVMMFFPNDENIIGLAKVAREVRAENADMTKARKLVFCPSNVPDLDDEDEILKELFGTARSMLRAPEFPVVINHYDSLKLLKHPLFVLERPRSRLAEQYRGLTAAIIKGNVEDREGALARLRELQALLEGDVKRSASDLSIGTQQIDDIAQIHGQDAEVAWELSRLYGTLGRSDAELAALNVAVERGAHVPDALARRGTNRLIRSDADGAVEDFRSVLRRDDVGGVLAASVVELLRSHDKDGWLPAVVGSRALGGLPAEELGPIVELLMTERAGLSEAVRLSKRVIAESASIYVKGQAQSYLVLSLIGAAAFAEALDAIGTDEGTVLGSSDVTLVFNYAMARWGLTGRPPTSLLERVLRLDDQRPDIRNSNYHQCLSLVAFELGDVPRAKRYLQRSLDALPQDRLFSAWRYLSVDRQTMLQDLTEQARYVDAIGRGPRFLRKD